MLALPCVRSVSRSNACFGFQSSGLFHEVPFELAEVVRERSLGTRLDRGGPGCTWGTSNAAAICLLDAQQHVLLGQQVLMVWVSGFRA
jgi:hypothetical protein